MRSVRKCLATPLKPCTCTQRHVARLAEAHQDWRAIAMYNSSSGRRLGHGAQKQVANPLFHGAAYYDVCKYSVHASPLCQPVPGYESVERDLRLVRLQIQHETGYMKAI